MRGPRFFIFAFIFQAAFGSLISGPAAAWGPRESKVVLLASPIRVKPFQGKMTADAIENPGTAAPPQALVVFKIERVMKGSLPQIKSGGDSKMKQAGDALSEHNYLKFLAADFQDPDRMEDKAWISIAVADPAKTFQITSWEDPGNRRYILHFKTVPGRPGSYILVESRLKN